jgi:hypothetical protein
VRLAWLALAVVLLPLAAGQSLSPSVDVTLAAIPAAIAADGAVVLPLEVTLTVAGMICTGDTVFAVPVTISVTNVTGGNLSVADVEAVLEPALASFVVPGGTTVVTSFAQSRTLTAVIDRPKDAEQNVAVELLIAAGAATGTCMGNGEDRRNTASAITTLSWTSPEIPVTVPDQIMPFPTAWAAVLLALVLARKGLLDDDPK